MVTNSDGSLAIVPASPAHLPGAVLASDGSVSLAPDTDVVINQDGSVTVAGATLPPGTQVQRTEDGGLVVRPPAPASTSLPAGTLVMEAADGTRTVNGAPLPSPRLVSVNIHNDVSAPHVRYSLMMMQWGQFVDHDITHTPVNRCVRIFK